jgi:hypothetical protein
MLLKFTLDLPVLPFNRLWCSLFCFLFSLTLTEALVASDIVKGNEKVEIQAMQLIIGMWAWGFLISPVISGAVSPPPRMSV